MKKRVLITGATGFLGRQIVQKLSNLGVSLTIVLREGKEDLVKDIANVDRVITTHDLFFESQEWWTEACKNVEIVIHAAWYVTPGIYMNSKKNLDCLVGSINLAKGAHNAKVKKFVSVGTCFEYDLKGNKPLKVESTLNPMSLYASSKVSLYFCLKELFRLGNTEFAWCRLFYLYGEGEDVNRLIPYIHKRLQNNEDVLLGDGNQLLDFIDIKKAAEMICTVAVGKFNGTINICSGVGVSVKDLAYTIADQYGRRDLVKLGQLPKRDFDPEFVVGVPMNLESNK